MVKYYVVDGETAQPFVHKTEAVAKFPVQTTIKQVQSFLGLVGYFRKYSTYVGTYALIAKPLTNLLKSEEKIRFEAE